MAGATRLELATSGVTDSCSAFPYDTQGFHIGLFSEFRYFPWWPFGGLFCTKSKDFENNEATREATKTNAPGRFRLLHAATTEKLPTR